MSCQPSVQTLVRKVLNGQRGDDHILTGEGHDLAIGDGGSNKITVTLDVPRIYQMYRSLPSPASTAAGYALSLSSSDFGFTFTSDFDLYPNPSRFVDSQASFVDQLITFDETSVKSNVLRDILGISAIKHAEGYCL